MEHTTYLLGAGASAGAIPVVSEIKNELSLLAGDARALNPNQDPITVPLFGQDVGGDNVYRLRIVRALQDFTNVMVYLQEIAERHPSIDTYGRKLYLQGRPMRDELKRFKSSLTLFLTVLEARKVPDKRYDLWLASILQQAEHSNELILPSNVNILSWNYDNQLERVYSEYVADRDHLETNDLIHRSTTGLGISEKYDHKRSIQKGGSNLVKLNGSAKYALSHPKYAKTNPLLKTNKAGRIDPDAFLELMNLHADACDPKKRNSHSMISFAWERETSIDFKQDLQDLLAETYRLVVIGYSFPDFNRNIDVLLARQMTGVQICHIVETDGNHEFIKQRIQETFTEAGNIKGDQLNWGFASSKQFPITSELRFKK